ncbi:MAG: hypothetical protein J7497_15925 [Chitinophagaceae bacterium]|nr:hypothetical protein [Chitinophagaceae bacterium]
MTYLRIYETLTGGAVDIHPLHGVDELPANAEAACILANHGYQIELLPSIPVCEIQARKEWLWDVFDAKNPDVRIDGFLIGDIKTPLPEIPIRKATINRCIYACAKQKVEVAIINLRKKEYTIQDIKKGIIGALQPDRNTSIQEVWIITCAGNLFRAERSQVFDESIYDALNYL